MEIKPFTGPLGAYVTDIDISKPLSTRHQTQLQQALLGHHLLLFRKNTLNAVDQIRFSSIFGQLETFPWSPSQLRNHPEIFRLANNSEDGYENIGMYWHSDGSFRADPTAISIFHLITVPEQGGDTWFSNLSKTWLSLSKDIQEKFKNLNTTHRNNVIHRLVKTHPATQQQHIYLNIGLTAGIVGLSANESREIIEDLNEAMSQPENHYQHKWQPGDLIVADNFAVAHQAQPVNQKNKRIMHRTTVSAEGVFWRQESYMNNDKFSNARNMSS